MNIPSPGEISLIRSSIKNNLRIDGRENLDLRQLYISIGDLKQANGSSSLQISNSQIKIYCGLKANTIYLKIIYVFI